MRSALICLFSVLAAGTVAAQNAKVTMPPILVGRWAEDCQSIPGEIRGITIFPDGRIEANDG